MLEKALESHRQGDYAEAENKYREMLAQEPENYELLHLLAVLKQETGFLDEAMELINQAIDLRPESAAYLAVRGSILKGQGDIGGAIADLEKALELNPNLPQGHNTLGFLQFPVTIPKVVLVLRLEIEEQDWGRAHGIAVTIYDEADEVVTTTDASVELPADAEGRQSIAFFQLFEFVRLTFARPGEYEVVVEVGDEAKESVLLTLGQLEPPD